MRRIFTAFVVAGKTRTEIARELNGAGIVRGLGNPWSPQAVHDILTSEYYVGDNVFNRASLKLKQKAIPNPPHMWIPCEIARGPKFDPLPYIELARDADRERRTRHGVDSRDAWRDAERQDKTEANQSVAHVQSSNEGRYRPEIKTVSAGRAGIAVNVTCRKYLRDTSTKRSR